MATQQVTKGNKQPVNPPPAEEEEDDFFEDDSADGDDSGGGEDDEVMDLSDVDEKDADFENCPAGVWDAVVSDAEYGESQRSGKKMITWEFEVTSKNPKASGKKLKTFTVTETPNGKARLKKMLVRIAPNLNMAVFKPASTPQTLIGTPCRLKVALQKYQGELRSNVKDVLPPAANKVFGGDE